MTTRDVLHALCLRAARGMTVGEMLRICEEVDGVLAEHHTDRMVRLVGNACEKVKAEFYQVTGKADGYAVEGEGNKRER